MMNNYNLLSYRKLSKLSSQGLDLIDKEANSSSTTRMKWLLSLMLFFAICFSGNNLKAQTVLLSGTGDGGFETGTTFTANSWTYVGSGTRTWQVGTAGGAQGVTRAAYAGAAANANGINANVVHHFYRDIAIPAGATNVFLNYFYKQIAVDNTYDFFYVSTTTTANTPSSGTVPGAGYNIRFTNTATVYSAFTAMPQINLTSLAGTTVRIVFSFKSDGIAPHVSPTVDNVSLVYTAGVACTGAPNNGTIAISQASACSGGNLNFTSSGLTTGTGITYQWQSSTTNSNPWTNLGTGTSYSATSVAGTTYYRLATTCSNSSTTSYSNTVSFAGVSCGSANVPTTGNTTIDCGTNTLIYDNGGPSLDYANNSDGYLVLDNSGTGVISISGSYTYLETNYDYLRFYSGVGTGGTLLYTYSNSSGGTITPFSSAPGQSITVQLTSDISGVGGGFALQAIYSGTCLTCTTPVGGTANAVASTFCNSGSTNIAATGYSSGTGTRYQWESSTNNFATAGTPIGSVASAYANLATGTITTTTYYRLKVFCTSNPTGAVYSSVVTVTVNTPATITASTDNTNFCVGGSANLSVSGAATYTWTSIPAGFNSILANPSVSPTVTTTYSVVGVDSNSCTTSPATVAVVILATPSAVSVIPSAATVCDGTIVTLTATGGSITPFIQNVYVENFDSGLGSFTATTGSSNAVSNWTPRANGYVTGVTYSGSTNGFVLADADAGGSGVTVNTNLISSSINTTGYTNLTLSFNEYLNNPTSTQAAVEISSDNFATFTVLRNDLVTDIGSSTAFATTSFAVPAPFLNQTNVKVRFRYVAGYDWYWAVDEVRVTTLISPTAPITWTATPASTLYTNALATAGNEYVPGNSATTLYAKPSVQTTYTASATNGTCSAAPASTIVNVNAVPVITLANSITVCKGTGATITIPENNNTYSWSPSTGITVLDIQSVLANPVSTQIYTVTTTNTSTFCQSTRQITVNVNDPGTIVTQPTNKVAATGFGTTYTVVGTTGITYGYQWQRKTGPTTYTNLVNNANYADVDSSVLTVSNAGTGTAISGAIYRCLLTPPSPCADLSTDDVTLTVSSTGIAASPSDVNICLPTPTTAQFSVVTNGDPAYLVEWQVSTNNGLSYSAISLIDVDDTFLYLGENTSAVSGLTFSHPLDAGDPTGCNYKILNVSGISSPATLKFKAFVNESLPSEVATLKVGSPITFDPNLSTVPVKVCAAPSAAPVTLSITTLGTVDSVVWKYATSAGGTYTVLTTSPPAGVTYATAISGSTYSLTVTTTALITPIGNYYYKAFVTSSGPCANVDSNEAVISVIRPAIAIAQSSASYCLPGAAVTLTASGSDAGNYVWSSSPAASSDTTAGISVTPSVTTSYTVLGTDSNGCTNSATVNVGVGTSFTVVASAAPATVCPGGSVALSAVPTAAGGTTYLINTTPYQFASVAGTFTALVGGTSSGLAATADDTMSGNIVPGSGFSFTYGGTAYTAFRASSNGQLVFGSAGTQSAANDLASTTSTERPGLAPLWDDTQLTAGLTYQLSGTAPNRVLTVEWLNMEWNYASTTPVISYQVKLYETTNVVEYVYRRESTAISSGSASIGLMGTASSNFISLQDTSASPALSTSTSANSISTKPTNGRIYRFTPVTPITYSYAWSSTPSGFSATGAPATANPNVSTVYSVTATSNQGCTATNTASVTVDSVPAVFTALPATQNICAGTTATFTVSATSATPLTYVWKKDGPPLSNGSGVSGATTATLTITGTTAANNGSYTVDVINCSTVTSTATVLTVNPLPTATVTGTISLCQNAVSPSITFTGAAGTAPYTFTYKLNDGADQIITTTSGSSVIIAAPTAAAGSFVYSLVSVNDSSSSACSQSQAGSATITISPVPTNVAAASNPTSVCFNTPFNLTSSSNPVPGIVFVQNFDGVTAPALPSGWLSIVTGEVTACVTSVSGSDTAPNSAFISNPASVSDKLLRTPTIAIVSAAAQLNFRHRYGFESGFDGGVLEIKIGAGAFTDIVAAGGSFVANGYTSTISSTFSNPIGGRSAWSGTNAAYVTVTVNLPAVAAGQNIQLRWRMGSDSSTGSTGWFIDTVSIIDSVAPTYSWTSSPVGFTSNLQNPVGVTAIQSTTYTVTATTPAGCTSTASTTVTVTPQPLWYLDADADGYYTGTSIASCTSPGVGYTT
ncbi:immunoglobulin domain-containing protein, partial [Flavobacterium sp.]|uniref:beta strand repeat-containing protein n=1 Tax=Flavobacterium sp. TaxID=239 RepID=UPI002489D10A|nr:hypothetical protein [Flavobacterium sp.]